MSFRLLRRGSHFYCRVWVPLDLRKLIGRRELKKSLRTDNRQEAKTQASLLTAKAEQFFLRARAGVMTDRELEILAAELIEEFTGRMVTHKKDRLDAISWLMSESCTALPSDIDIIDASLKTPRTPGDVAAAASWYAAKIEKLEQELSTEFFSRGTRLLARMIAAKKGLDVELPPADWFNEPGREIPRLFQREIDAEEVAPAEFEESESWDKPAPQEFHDLCVAVIKAQIDAYRYEAERVQGKTDTQHQQRIAARIEAAKPRPKLSDLWREYHQEKVTRKKWREGTLAKNRDEYNEAVAILGDRELSQYDDPDASTLIEAMQNRKKKPLSVKSINFRLELLSSMFKFALDNDERWVVKRNPFAKKQLEDNREEHEKRDPYGKAEIEGMFRELSKIRIRVEPEKFWVPLICLYSGMRANEACQLRVDDIETVDGVLIFNIRHRPELNQTTKNEKSRTCPVHPTLKKIGFTIFVEQQREAGQDRLFSNLKMYQGKWQNSLTKWYNRTPEPKFTKNPKHSFHSTRHTMIDWFVQHVNLSFTNLDLLKSLVGHMDKNELDLMTARGGITRGTYAKLYPFQKQYDFLRKLNYDVDLELLNRR